MWTCCRFRDWLLDDHNRSSDMLWLGWIRATQPKMNTSTPSNNWKRVFGLRGEWCNVSKTETILARPHLFWNKKIKRFINDFQPAAGEGACDRERTKEFIRISFGGRTALPVRHQTTKNPLVTEDVLICFDDPWFVLGDQTKWTLKIFFINVNTPSAIFLEILGPFGTWNWLNLVTSWVALTMHGACCMLRHQENPGFRSVPKSKPQSFLQPNWCWDLPGRRDLSEVASFRWMMLYQYVNIFFGGYACWKFGILLGSNMMYLNEMWFSSQTLPLEAQSFWCFILSSHLR